MGGSISPKSFPWPTAIGNSPNVNPLVSPQAPSVNGPGGTMTPGSPTGAPSPNSPLASGMPTPTAPNTPAMPVGQPAPSRPISSPISLPRMPAFYGQ